MRPADFNPAGFVAALLDPSQPLPPELVTWNGADPRSRFDVHRNNLMRSLIDALADGFPVTRALVGEPFFTAMARAFVAEQPPSSPILSDYGEAFADFIDAFSPAGNLAYLPDLARLERARVLAYHAADRQPLAAGELARHLGDPAQLPAARVTPHPACRLIASKHAIASLWAAHQGEGRLENVDLSRPESALVLRDDETVLVVPLSPAAGRFVDALLAGGTLAAATEAATHAATGEATGTDEQFDLTQTLGLFIHHGGIAAWHPPGASEP